MRVVLWFLLLSTSCISATIHVPVDQPSIQAGIDAASPGDTVLVACGTYYEHDITMKSGILLKSESGTSNCVVVDAQNEDRVFLCEILSADTAIRGFTITGGIIEGGWPQIFGGGLCCQSSDLTIANCDVVGNEGNYYGGGIYFDGCTARLEECNLANNHASSGGAVYCWNSMVTMVNCTLYANSAASIGGVAFM